MAVLKPEHLLEQASKLVSSKAGPPRQANIRRAISAAYYAVFHFALTEAADQFVGVTRRSTNLYELVYRSVDHKWLKELCRDVQKPSLPQRYSRYAPNNGFGSNISEFAAAAVELQEKRHIADYDPLASMSRSDALAAIDLAQEAIRRFKKANSNRRRTFLSLLMFPPR